MPSDRPRQLYHEWLYKASEDELSIRAILKEGAPSTACFLSQQMAEKYLKGLLLFHQQPLVKVHDLLQLETMMLTCEPDIITIHGHLTFLNRYYIETRYPGDFPEFSLTEAKDAFAAAVAVKDFVMPKIPE